MFGGFFVSFSRDYLFEVINFYFYFQFDTWLGLGAWASGCQNRVWSVVGFWTRRSDGYTCSLLFFEYNLFCFYNLTFAQKNNLVKPDSFYFW